MKYNILTTAKPLYLHHLITVQPHQNTCSSSLVTLSRPPSLSSLKITDRFFHYASPCLKNQLPVSLRQLRINLSTSDSDLSFPWLFISAHKLTTVSLSITLSFPAQKLPFSQIPSHHRPVSLTGLTS